MSNKTRVIDVDLSSYFDNIRHHLLLEQVARRVSDGGRDGVTQEDTEGEREERGTAGRG